MRLAPSQAVELFPGNEPHSNSFFPRQVDHRLQSLVVAFARDLQVVKRAAPRAQCLFHRMDSEDNVHCSQVYK
jgi:hypothetical protein